MVEIQVGLDALYDYMLKTASGCERFEFGDEVMDVVEPKQRPKFVKTVNELAERLDLGERVRYLKDIDGNADEKKAVQKADFTLTLNRMFEKAHGEPTLVRKIVPQEWVDREQESLVEKYRMMAQDYYGSPQPLDLSEDRIITWDKSNIEFLESETLLDDLVKFGSTLIKDFEDVWRVTFFAQASTVAPPIMQNEKEHRAQINVLIAGEYSTSKSGLVGYMSKMFPKVVRCSDTTGPGLMGTIKKDGTRVMGLAEEANRSILVLDELDKLMGRNGTLDGILRVVTEDHHFSRQMAYGKMEYDTHPSVFGMANPKKDVFYSNESLASQVPFKTGFLSRFDYIRPMAYSKEKINSIAGFIARTAFKSGETKGKMTTRDVLQTYYALQSSVTKNNVRQVACEESLLMDVHERFCKLQKDVDGIPLLSVRDFMSSMRTLNASAILHHMNRTVSDGIVMASDQDRDEAIYLMDNAVKSRETLLGSYRRQDVCSTPIEKAHGHLKAVLERQGTMTKQDAVTHLMQSMGIGHTSAYKYVSIIVDRDKEIRQDGLRDAELVLAR